MAKWSLGWMKITLKEEVKPGKYIWRRKDGDRPIVIIESLGEMEGREYVRIEGSSTGIPFDECVKI